MHRHELPQPFAELGIEIRFLKALAKMEFKEPSDIQRALIPPALQGRDLMGQARTGTGKTAAFGLPILQQIDRTKALQAICLVPTRELAVQVSAEVQRLAEFSSLHVVPIYGGQKISTQLHVLGRKPHFVVGTPGRVLDFMNRKVLNLEGVRHAVLDEVDRMLDIGFRDDIRMILKRITGEHQTIFVSATIDDEIKRLANTFMQNPLEINVSQDRLTVDEIDQSFVTVDRQDKYKVLRLVLEQEDPPICIVFCNTKAMVRKLAKRLHQDGIDAKAIEGDLVQKKRDQVMKLFRRHQVKVLVATDLAARGIDVSMISHIINYDIPQDTEGYVHRIGRTARMGARGVAITFVTREEGKELTAIEKLINCEIQAREVSGFTLAPPEPEPERPKEPARVSRLQEVAPSGESAGHRKPPRTLGGRFRPARRRR